MYISDLHLNLAVTALRQGGVIAYPTEGVWGLGCDPHNEQAVQRLLEIKGRDAGKGLILIAGGQDQVEPLLEGISDARRQQLEATWPGPVTWVIDAHGRVPRWITGRHPTVAVRVTDHPLVQALCRRFGGPLVSTSANPSGLPAARDSLRVRMYFGDALAYSLPGLLGGRSKPSQIRDLASGRVLRA